MKRNKAKPELPKNENMYVFRRKKGTIIIVDADCWYWNRRDEDEQTNISTD
jgi:hypothetical protein